MARKWTTQTLGKKIGAKLDPHWLATAAKVIVVEWNTPYLTINEKDPNITTHMFRSENGNIGRFIRSVYPGVLLVDVEHYKGTFTPGEMLTIGVGHVDTKIPDDHILLSDEVLSDGARAVHTVHIDKFEELFGAVIPADTDTGTKKTPKGNPHGSHAALLEQDDNEDGTKKGYARFFDKWRDEGLLQ